MEKGHGAFHEKADSMLVEASEINARVCVCVHACVFACVV